MSQKQLIYKNTTINYYDKGKGNTIVFLHGFLENHKMWLPFLDRFSQNHRVIAIDLLGHGNTGCLGYVHTMEEMADAIFAVISDLKIRKITLIGHSMGGYVALAFAELYPDNIRGIALVASTARADSDERILNRNRAIELVKKNHTSFIKISITNLFQNENRTLFEKEINETKEEALKTPLQGIIAALEGMKQRPDREVILHFAPYPITLILGTSDTVMPLEETKSQVEGTNVLLTELDGGHMLQIENQEDLEKELLHFIKIKKL